MEEDRQGQISSACLVQSLFRPIINAGNAVISKVAHLQTVPMVTGKNYNHIRAAGGLQKVPPRSSTWI